jgi:hypothetical protein
MFTPDPNQTIKSISLLIIFAFTVGFLIGFMVRGFVVLL